MDPVATAIIAAITAGVLSGVTEASKKIIADAYDNLKKILRLKFGNNNDVVKAIKSLEKKPDSIGRQETLKEEISSLGAEKDEEVLMAAQEILVLLQDNPDTQHVQNAIGNFIAQADRNSSASVNVSNPKNHHERK